MNNSQTYHFKVFTSAQYCANVQTCTTCVPTALLKNKERNSVLLPVIAAAAAAAAAAAGAAAIS